MVLDKFSPCHFLVHVPDEATYKGFNLKLVILKDNHYQQPKWPHLAEEKRSDDSDGMSNLAESLAIDVSNVTGSDGQKLLILGETRSIPEKPTDEEAHYLLGECYLHQGILNRANESFSRAIKLKPDYQQEIGKQFRSAGDNAINGNNPQSAISLYQKAIQYNQQLKKERYRSISQSFM